MPKVNGREKPKEAARKETSRGWRKGMNIREWAKELEKEQRLWRLSQENGAAMDALPITLHPAKPA